MTPLRLIRNFAIIAHIDHGKSTLADRLIEACGGLAAREMRDQVLDSMEIERERGITIKAQTVRLVYRAQDGETYVLNLMDTPGHVDFAYEVSRSLAACEGSLLVVDASQGVEAQTLANVYQAIEAGHEIVPVLNKIDLPAAEPDRVKEQIEDVIGLDASNALLISAKTGRNVDQVLEALVTRLPPPQGDVGSPLKALLVDSWYDPYLGVVILVRVKDGALAPGQKVRLMATDAVHTIEQVGVFCSLFPTDAADFERLRDSLAKLRLNDASFEYEPETSVALGFGFRCGFLGLLHLEIVQERLTREFDLDLLATAPSVVYRVHLLNGAVRTLHNPADMPDPVRIDHVEEPWIKATILVPDAYLGSILALCEERRGEQVDLTYAGNRAMLIYRLPLNEVVFDFYDRLKSVSRGYASFDYQIDDYREGDLVLMNILVNSEPVDALAVIVHRKEAERRGRALCERLKDLIPRQLFQVAIQAAIGGRIIARETVKALRKDVLAKCYGGDVTRKRKLLEKQKEGKKRMRQFGRVEIPQSAFIAALKMGDG